MSAKPPVTILRRYTSLASLLALLQDKKLTLLSPTLWEDRNDAFTMSQYKARKNLKTLLALCFSESDEAYHHWRVFTHELRREAREQVQWTCESGECRELRRAAAESVHMAAIKVYQTTLLESERWKKAALDS